MTTISYPAKGTGGLTISQWTEMWEDSSGVINDYTGNSLALTRIDAGEIARVAVGQVRVGGYVLEVTANHDLTVGTAAATYYIWASYDPSLNVGTAADPNGPCRLGISTGAPSTSGGKIYTLLYQIVRGASQALTAATVRDFRTWVGPTLHIPSSVTLPSEILTDPETSPTGFSYPVGSQLVYGSTRRYTHIKSTSGLKWAAAGGVLPDQQFFTATGTWSKPADARWVHVRVQAGGGAGGGAPTCGSGESSAGAGGEGGGYAESLLDATTLSDTVAVTVGAGGVASSGGSGGAGGTSSFGVSVSATGGAGGAASAASSSPVATSGANSAQTLVGHLQLPGGGGGALIRLGSGQGGVGGTGGSSTLGRGGGGRGGNNNGLAGKNYGGGGGGAANEPSSGAQSGGAGAPGVVVITTFFN